MSRLKSDCSAIHLDRAALHFNRSAKVVAAVALVVAAAVSGSSPAFADPPVVSTSSRVTVVMPSPSYAEYTGIEVDLSSVPNPRAISIVASCDGFAPIPVDVLFGDPAHPTDVIYITHASNAISGKTCTITGHSSVSNQTVDFFSGATLSTEKGVPITTVRGQVVIHSRIGGLG